MNWDDNKPHFRHFVIELEYQFKEVDSLSWVKEKVAVLLKKLDIQKIKNIEYLFEPQGASIIYIISSSHLSIHTWPENNYIHIELLTCSKSQKFDSLSLICKEVFPNLQYKISELTY